MPPLPLFFLCGAMIPLQSPSKPQTLNFIVPPHDQGDACDLLAEQTGLSKTKLKEAMNKGAVWIKRGRKEERLRKATFQVKGGDQLTLYYDPTILAIEPPLAECLFDGTHYSVWDKPPGLLAQGTRQGDHCALLRQVEKHLMGRREIPHLVHRLDREAEGLMLIAHGGAAAEKLSALFREGKIAKRYRIQVRGNPADTLGSNGLLEEPLDGKTAKTGFSVESFDERRNVATVMVDLFTGRKHQIRRHFELAGYPVMGDPRYGENNSDPEGLRLMAVELRFVDPWNGRDRSFVLPPERLLF
ncbi:MAG: RNA pseudouridine synthase [Alphaproteobacteria bacterium CG_4_10_14_0_2_um_filter_63_37]|nr:MAG: RNA pseudouridine synthase [Alphaproteobacteria bacterium CG_4_10_14_0_2_um_filter_63_37]